MADRVEGLLARRRDAAQLDGASRATVPGRGPTYERVQQLLMERRARVQQAREHQRPEDQHRPDDADRHPRQFPSPRSDRSFEFDRPPAASPAASSHPAKGTNADYATEMDSQWRQQIQPQHQQQTWDAAHVEAGGVLLPPDDDEYSHGLHTQGRPQEFTLQDNAENYEYQALQEDDRQRVWPRGDRGMQAHADSGQQRGREDEASFPQSPEGHGAYRPQRAQDRDDGGLENATLAELEQMLHQTMQQFNLTLGNSTQANTGPPAAMNAGPGPGVGAGGAHSMRVPSNKDMALAMGDREGPFDISDIWAVESQPSASQPSVSHSEQDQARDHGQEVNSYVGANRRQSRNQQMSYDFQEEQEQEDLQYDQQQQQEMQQERPYAMSLANPRAGGYSTSTQGPAPQPQALEPHPHHPQQHEYQPQPQRQYPAAPDRSVSPIFRRNAAPQQRPASGLASSQQRPLQQQQQQHGRQGAASRPASPGPGATRSSAASMRRSAAAASVSHLQRQQRPLSAQGTTRRSQGAGGVLDGMRGAGAAAAAAAAASLGRRPVSPRESVERQRPRSAYANVSPRYNQPPAGMVAAQQHQQQQEPVHYPAFPFRPQINQRSREIAQRLLPIDRDRRLEQLSRPRNEKLLKRAEELRQAKEEEELRDCTFRPQTGRPPSNQRARPGVPVHDRLYRMQPAWPHKRDEILREREASVLADCTFQPQCGSRAGSAQRQRPTSCSHTSHHHHPVSHGGPVASSHSRPAAAPGAGQGQGHVPIHQRVADLLRHRNERLAKAQLRAELDSGSITFQPELNRRSVQLVAERQRQQPAELAALPASERLYMLAKAKQPGGREEGDVRGARDQQEQQPEQQGVPAINPRSRALAESSDLPQDFLTRQAYLAALSHEKRALYRSLLEESTCTFQPHILNKSRSGSLGSSGQWGNGSLSGGSYGDGPAGHQGQGSGTSEDRISRLAYGDVQKSAALRDALAQHHYGQFTFAPAINERSRRIGRRHSLTDLYRDDQRQAKVERLASALEAQRAAECTFRPAINPRSASLGRQRQARRGSLVLASTEVHEQAAKLRNSILVEARALREYEELKECTFTPAINREAPKPTGPVVVPGLGRHMELREMARRKREADEARKAEVWNQRPKSPGPRTGVTVPQPFSFEARVMPWQAPRSHQQQDQQQKALHALKEQRQLQRRDAEARRSANLQRIMQEAEHQEQQQQRQNQHRHPHQRQHQQLAQGAGQPLLQLPSSTTAHGQARQGSAPAGGRQAGLSSGGGQQQQEVERGGAGGVSGGGSASSWQAGNPALCGAYGDRGAVYGGEAGR